MNSVDFLLQGGGGICVTRRDDLLGKVAALGGGGRYSSRILAGRLGGWVGYHLVHFGSFD